MSPITQTQEITTPATDANQTPTDNSPKQNPQATNSENDISQSAPLLAEASETKAAESPPLTEVEASQVKPPMEPETNESDTSQALPTADSEISEPEKPIETDVPFQLMPFEGSSIVIPKSPPTWLEAFLGYMFDVRQQLKESLQTVEDQITKIQNLKPENDSSLSPMQAEQLTQLIEYRKSLLESLQLYQWTTPKMWLYQYSLVFLLFLMTVFEATAVVVYARWHGTNLITIDFYSQAQINLLSNINFVNGPTTMSIIAEILMWSSLGVWASYSYQYGKLMLRREFRFGDHGPMYIAHLMRNTSVVAAVILLFRLSQFSIFGVSIGDNTQLGFDSTIGLAFLLGFFGDDATRLLLAFRDLVFGQVKKQSDEADLT